MLLPLDQKHRKPSFHRDCKNPMNKEEGRQFCATAPTPKPGVCAVDGS